jgi:hypothetical protein
VLFDISQPLLNAAYQHALDTFGEQSPSIRCCLQGNFPDLAHYPRSATRPRKVGGGGSTRCWETRSPTSTTSHASFKHCMSHCQPGDFLVLDIRQTPGTLMLVKRRFVALDFVLHGPFSKTHAEWLSTPIRTHCPDLVKL